MSLETLEARIQILEDIEAIKKLKAHYCRLCDAGLDQLAHRDELIGHFLPAATVDFGMGPASIFTGKEGLEMFFGQVVPAAVSYCMHMVHNPLIEVCGDEASGVWYFEAPTTDAASGRAQWMVGRYDERYARAGGTWKFSSIKVLWDFISPYEDGWAKNRGELLEKLKAA